MSFAFVVDGVNVIMPPPDGYKVNFAHPTQRHATTAYVLFGIGLTLSTFCFFQYLFVKLRLMRKFDLHVAFLIIGWMFSVSVQFIELSSFLVKAVGVHAWEMPIERFQRSAYYMLITPILTAVTTGFCKTALAMFYHGLSPQPWWINTSCVCIFLQASHSIAIFVAALCSCRPFARNWDLSVPGVCIDRPALYVANAALGVGSDLILLIMPIPMIIGLQMPAKQKIGLLIFFAVGSLTFVTAILRVIFLLPILTSLDLTWEVSNTTIILNIEANLNIICATLITLRRFFVHISPHIIGERGSSAQKYGSGGAARFQKHSFKTFGSNQERKKVDEFGMTVDEVVIEEDGHKMVTLNRQDDIESRGQTLSEMFVVEHNKPPSSSHSAGDSISENRTWDSRPDDDMEPERAIFHTWRGISGIPQHGTRPQEK